MLLAAGHFFIPQEKLKQFLKWRLLLHAGGRTNF